MSISNKNSIIHTKGLPRWLSCKESPANAGATEDLGSIPRLGRSPGGTKWKATLEFLPGKSPWREEPGGYSPLGTKESDMTEHTHTY